METLILSCSTGGGHNTAAQAVLEALHKRGHRAVRMDPYTLVSDDLAEKVGQTYIKLVQKSPKLFGAVYDLGNAYRRLPGRSPVYHINGKMAPYVQKYLAENKTDVIVCTHLYPAEILTHMRLNGMETPPFVFIATDYTCIPFTEESDCDLYVTPSPLLNDDFAGRGIPAEKLRPLGIPVRLDFCDDTVTKEIAREKLGLKKDRRTLLLSGGSMGAGSIVSGVRALLPYLNANPDTDLLILCGSNEALFDKAEAEFAEYEQITPMHSTDKMALYLKASDVFISKPGGLSSTESAAAGVPLVHISPIPGCESRNAEFFAKEGIAVRVEDAETELLAAVKMLSEPEKAEEMRKRQREIINKNAAMDICELLERITQR